jgi:C1A family cysteine protease
MNDTNIGTNIGDNADKKDKMNIKSIFETRRSILDRDITKCVNDKNVVNTTNNLISGIPNNELHQYIPRYGWNPDIPDHRDYQYSDLRKKIDEENIIVSDNINPVREYKVSTIDSIQIPIPSPLSFVDLRPMDSPIFDQGSLGSCTGNALAGALQFLEKKDKVPYTALSRLFIYYDERVVENTVNIDSGAQIRDGIKTLVKLGVCSETCWPYNIQNFAAQPNQNCYKEASKHRILSYYRLNTLGDMLHCLDNGYPFIFGFSCYQSFESEEVAKTGIVNMPGKEEQLLGGHAVTCVGYDDNTQRFLVRNSWGISWGQQGYFTIPYAYLENRNLSDDLWCIRRGINL